MAEACVRTLKRDDARASSLPDAKTVISLLPAWFEHDNARHPHRALGYLHPASSWRIVWLPKPESACPILEALQQLRHFEPRCTLLSIGNRMTFDVLLQLGQVNLKTFGAVAGLTFNPLVPTNQCANTH